MTKLDQSQVERIIREKRKGTHNKIIAEQAGVSVRWIQKLWKRYKKKDKIIFPETMGRSKKDTSGCREYSAVLSAISKARHGAFTLERVVKNFIGIHILHNTIHKMLRDADTSENQPKKSERRK